MLLVRTLLVASLLSLLFSPARAQSPGWVVSRTNLPQISQAAAIAYGNGRFVVTFHTRSDTAPSAAWSTDGLTWNASQLTFPTGASIVFVSNAFYLVGGRGVYRSIDGNIWEKIYTTPTARDLSHIVSDGRGLLVGYGLASPYVLLYSSDRVTFHETAPIPDTGAPNRSTGPGDFAYVNGRYFVNVSSVLSNGLPGSAVYWTTDGTSWTASPTIATASFIVSGNGRLVTGDGVSRVTTDGLTFVTGSLSPLISNGGRMGYAGGRFFYLGTLNASTDGLTWGTIASVPPATGYRYLMSIAYGHGRYVAVGFGDDGSPSATASDLIITLAAPAPPVISTGVLDQTAVEGTTTTFSLVVENSASGSLAYQWRRNGIDLAGATGATYSIASVKATDAGLYSVAVRNSLGATFSDPAALTVAPAVVAPLISVAPAPVSIVAGGQAVFSVTSTGTAPFSYQWFRDGSPVPGATTNPLTVNSALLANAGAYTVTVTNSAGSVTAAAATLTVTPVSRISNLSVLTSIDALGDSFTLGFVVGGLTGAANKPLVIRAAGPSLSTFGVSDFLADPKFELFAGPLAVGGNDNWGGSASVADLHASVGAFAYLSPTSKDAAANIATTTRDNSVKVSAATAATGVVLAEIYDATAPANFTSATPRFLNVSVLKPLGHGLTVGFTLAGTAPKTVLIRAVGPTLGQPPFGVGDVEPDPRLTLFNGSVQIGQNDNWSGTTALSTAFTGVGAFTLPATSKDAALLVSLSPGAYSVQAAGTGSPTAQVLVEIYEVP